MCELKYEKKIDVKNTDLKKLREGAPQDLRRRGHQHQGCGAAAAPRRRRRQPPPPPPPPAACRCRRRRRRLSPPRLTRAHHFRTGLMEKDEFIKDQDKFGIKDEV